MKNLTAYVLLSICVDYKQHFDLSIAIIINYYYY